jgi:dUTP pyrophosphatase
MDTEDMFKPGMGFAAFGPHDPLMRPNSHSQFDFRVSGSPNYPFVVPQLVIPRVNFMRNRPGAITPTRATGWSAGYDLHACIDDPIECPGAFTNAMLVPTGICLDMSPMREHMVAYIFPRSGMGHKHGFTLGNGVGVIDRDYQGEIMVSLVRRTNHEPYTINPGDRIAQLVFMPIFAPPLVEVENFETVTARGAGGFGSTGG